MSQTPRNARASASGKRAIDAIDVDADDLSPAASKKPKTSDSGSAFDKPIVVDHDDDAQAPPLAIAENASPPAPAPKPPTLAAESRDALRAPQSVAASAAAPRAVVSGESVLALIPRAHALSADAFRAALERDTRSLAKEFPALASAVGPLAASTRGRQNAATATSDDKSTGRANRVQTKGGLCKMITIHSRRSDCPESQFGPLAFAAAAWCYKKKQWSKFHPLQLIAITHLMLKRLVSAMGSGTACFTWSRRGTCLLLREMQIILDRDDQNQPGALQRPFSSFPL